MKSRDGYADLVSQLPKPAAADMAALWARAARGDAAAEELIAHQYLPFVISRVRFLGRRWPWLDFMDLVQEGNLALLRAIRRFDPRHGADITTYARYWIDQRIQSFARQHTNTVRIRQSGWDNLRRLRRTEAMLQNAGDAAPSFSDVVSKSGLTRRELSTALAAKVAIEQTVRLDAPVFDGEDSTLMDMIRDPDAKDPAEQPAEHREEIRRALAGIPAREAGVLRMRFGFCSDEPMTLEEVARVMGISRERVRQLETRALARCRVAIERLRRGLSVTPQAATKKYSYAQRILDLARRGVSPRRIRFALTKAGAGALTLSEIQSVLAVPA